MAFNPENRITWEELAPSLQELFKNLQSQITKEVERAKNEEQRLDRKIDDEIARATNEEQRIESKLNREISRSTQEDSDIHDELDEIKDLIQGDGSGEGGSGLIDVFAIDGREFYIHFTNGFKILNIITACYKNDTFVTDVGTYTGTECSLMHSFATSNGFTGFKHGNSYSVFVTTDESLGVELLDRGTLDYARGYTGQSIILSSWKIDEQRFVDNTQCILCIGY